MANSASELYSQYSERISRHLENDPYFSYLFRLVRESNNNMTQVDRVLKRVVDDKWLTAIENALPSINALISKPTRYIKTIEKLVTVDGTKAPAGGDDSESFYENRFLNTLLKKLVAFVDKQTDAVFWAASDEHMNVLNYETAFEDAFERVEYRVEMTVRNKQGTTKVEESSSGIYLRIDRARRILLEYNNSLFSQLMKDTAPVESPLTMTTALENDAEFKTCLDLWNFVENYESIGAETDIIEKPLPVDEDYVFQLYNNLILAYTVFKTILEPDKRRVMGEKTEEPVMGIRRIRELVNDYFDDREIPDKDMRAAVINEIVKAQIEIEKAKVEKRKEGAGRKKKGAANMLDEEEDS